MSKSGECRRRLPNAIPPIGNIQGTVWNDENGDGVHGDTESPLVEQPVYIDLNNNDSFDLWNHRRV